VTRRWPLLLLLLAACARTRDSDAPSGGTARAASADGLRAIPVVALRLRAAGGALHVYALPGLTPLEWALPGRTSPARATVGMDVAGRRLVYRDSAGAVIAFDLVAFRERPIAARGALADLGADGALLTLDRRGAISESQPWGARAWPDTLRPGTRALFAAPNSRLLLLRGRAADSLVGISRDGGAWFAVPVPAGARAAATREADAVAFASDSGLTVIEDRDPRAPWSVDLGDVPADLAFSPSGHRIYVALRDANALAVVDRFTHRERPRVPLPAPAGAVRSDPWGSVLFVRPAGDAATDDLTWVVGVAAGRVIGELHTRWSADLPTVSRSGVLLDREGSAVVARDAHSLDSLGAVAGAARDLWFLGAWAPSGTAAALQEARARDATARRPAPGPAAAPPAPAPVAVDPKSLVPAPDTATPVWAQISASQSEAASRALVAELVAAHQPARLIPPRSEGDGWRVVLGPFRTRDEAEAAGRALGRPFFVVERQLPAPSRP
jgi:hypothetical protein